MSRIGNKVIVIPNGVNVSINDNILSAKGPKGEAKIEIQKPLKVEIKGSEVFITRPNDEQFSRKIHGCMRALINNLIQGVHTPFKKVLEIQGVGYRANTEGKKLILQMGFSHNVVFDFPEGIDVSVEKNTIITISGIDKQKVGEFAAVVRKVRKPEPYKGKGIRYEGEHIRRKAGKTAK